MKDSDDLYKAVSGALVIVVIVLLFIIYMQHKQINTLRGQIKIMIEK